MVRSMFVVAMVALLLFVVGCGGPEDPVASSIVVDKEYRAAYTTMVPMVVNKTVTMMPQVHPAQRIIVVEEVLRSGDVRQRRHWVSKTEWDSVEVGDEWGVSE